MYAIAQAYAMLASGLSRRALVLMTGMGAGLTWGSALLEWGSTNGAGA